MELFRDIGGIIETRKFFKNIKVYSERKVFTGLDTAALIA